MIESKSIRRDTNNTKTKQIVDRDKSTERKSTDCERANCLWVVYPTAFSLLWVTFPNRLGKGRFWCELYYRFLFVLPSEKEHNYLVSVRTTIGRCGTFSLSGTKPNSQIAPAKRCVCTSQERNEWKSDEEISFLFDCFFLFLSFLSCFLVLFFFRFPVRWKVGSDCKLKCPGHR